jgi:hypothetical protein
MHVPSKIVLTADVGRDQEPLTRLEPANGGGRGLEPRTSEAASTSASWDTLAGIPSEPGILQCPSLVRGVIPSSVHSPSATMDNGKARYLSEANGPGFEVHNQVMASGSVRTEYRMFTPVHSSRPSNCARRRGPRIAANGRAASQPTQGSARSCEECG